MEKFCEKNKIIEMFQDEMTLMIGGFLACGTPERLIDAVLESGAKDLTMICNDTAFPGKGIGRLIEAKRIKKVLVSHIGTNPETGNQMKTGELEVILIPQGTLAEQVRAGGAGLGGVLTKTGLGTEVEKGKQKIIAQGENYILETALKADIALIKGSLADEYGNLIYKGTTSNFNPVMATAADIVIAEVEEKSKEALPPECIHTSGVYVDYLIMEGGE